MTELSTVTEIQPVRSLSNRCSGTDSDRPVTEEIANGHCQKSHLNSANTLTVTESDRNSANFHSWENADSDLGKQVGKRSTAVTIRNFGHYGHCVTSYPQAGSSLAGGHE